MPGGLPIQEVDEDIEVEIRKEAAREASPAKPARASRHRPISQVSVYEDPVEVAEVEKKSTAPPTPVTEIDPDNWLLLDQEVEAEAQREVKNIREMFSEQVDVRDTQMVAEYHEEIFEYMSQLEGKALPDPNYMERQPDIQWAMRTSLVDWLLQIHMRYHMLPETLWIAINIFDRFLSKRIVNVHKVQLVGVTSMFIAAKYEEVMAPSVDEFAYITHDGYTKEEILKGERVILETLDFEISTYCSPYTWVRRISKADDYDVQTRTLSKFLMEVTLLDHRFLRAKPSLIAAIGMYMARIMLGQTWNHAFVFYSGFTEAQLLGPARFLVEVLRDDLFEEKFLYKKYSNKKFLKASAYARNWSLSEASQEFMDKQPSRTPLPS
ncbi:A/B/D/E cyclin [Atractiella rhizophila]|nr:A/B/D/E cyclin [Atractiella rhizophila]